MIAVGVSACMWACGDDDDEPGNTGGSGGKGGVSGAAGKASGGTAGKASGGTAGKAGSSTGDGGTGGGDGGTGGGGDGGTGGTEAGAGGGGAGGDGGMGGMAGDGGMGGGGGEAGEPNTALTLVEACAQTCDIFFTGHPTACVEDADETVCNQACGGYSYDEPTEALFLSYVRCAATKLTDDADYACISDGTAQLYATPMMPVAAGECETELCAWACADQVYVDGDTLTRCACP